LRIIEAILKNKIGRHQSYCRRLSYAERVFLSIRSLITI